LTALKDAMKMVTNRSWLKAIFGSFGTFLEGKLLKEFTLHSGDLELWLFE
jgi:hypothetical protein